MVVTPKPASQSKYIWFNSIGALLTAFEAFTGIIQPHVSMNVFLIMTTIAVAGNAALRFYTSQPIGTPAE